jgi:hypothetical protein
MTSKSKKKKVDFTVRPNPIKEELPPTPEQWVEKGKAADTRPEMPVDVHLEKPADNRSEKDEKRLTLNLPPDLHTAFKARCVFEGITIQDKVRRLIERELAEGQRATGDKPGPP